MSYYYTGDRPHAHDIASLILSYIDDEIRLATERNKDTLTQVRDAARQVSAILRNREPVRSINSYGRNDRVKVRYLQSGSVEIKKYKQVEDDLEKGLCILIEE